MSYLVANQILNLSFNILRKEIKHKNTKAKVTTTGCESSYCIAPFGLPDHETQAPQCQRKGGGRKKKKSEAIKRGGEVKQRGKNGKKLHLHASLHK